MNIYFFTADFPRAVAERRCFPESVTVSLYGAKARVNKRQDHHRNLKLNEKTRKNETDILTDNSLSIKEIKIIILTCRSVGLASYVQKFLITHLCGFSSSLFYNNIKTKFYHFLCCIWRNSKSFFIGINLGD